MFVNVGLVWFLLMLDCVVNLYGISFVVEFGARLSKGVRLEIV